MRKEKAAKMNTSGDMDMDGDAKKPKTKTLSDFGAMGDLLN